MFKSQFFRFGLVGAASTTTTYLVLIVAVEFFGVNKLVASTAGYLLGAIVNYRLNYEFTFKSDQEHFVVAPKFAVVVIVGMFINAAVMHGGMKWLGLHYMFAQLAAVAVALLWSFTVSRLWAFSRVN